MERKKAAVYQKNGYEPGERKRMIEHGERRTFPKYGKYPYNAESAGAEHSADCRIKGVPLTAHDAGRNLVKIAKRLKKKNAQNAHGSALDDLEIAGEEPGEKAP